MGGRKEREIELGEDCRKENGKQEYDEHNTFQPRKRFSFQKQLLSFFLHPSLL